MILRVSDLREYVNKKNTLPENINEPYVVGLDTTIVDEQERFCVTWTTRRLSEMQKASRMIQVDATYKITWLGFPVLVCFTRAILLMFFLF